jgi:hypothetical protein
MDINFLALFVSQVFVLGSNEFSLGSGANEFNALTSNGHKIEVKLISNRPSGTCHAWRWGAEDACPATAIEQLDIRLDGEAVLISRSAFSDLGVPRVAKITLTKHAFMLVVSGGDAATSYDAELTFSKDAVEKRVVTGHEFPDRAREVTVFSYPN